MARAGEELVDGSGEGPRPVGGDLDGSTVVGDRPVGAPVYYGFPVIEGAEVGTLVLADTVVGALARTPFGADEKGWGR